MNSNLNQIGSISDETGRIETQNLNYFRNPGPLHASLSAYPLRYFVYSVTDVSGVYSGIQYYLSFEIRAERI